MISAAKSDTALAADKIHFNRSYIWGVSQM